VLLGSASNTVGWLDTERDLSFLMIYKPIINGKDIKLEEKVGVSLIRF
jgi:hypothetical protein